MILVFGKTGQIASELQTFNGVYALGREQVDLLEPLRCAQAIKLYQPRAVINAAAYTSVDQAETEEDLANIINGDAPNAMAIACAELEIPLVQISTDYVFNGSGINPWHSSDTTNPLNAYGRSKLRGEVAIKSSKCTYAILRTSWVVSNYGSNFVRTMLRLSETRNYISVVDDQIGGPTCARDIAQTCISIANQLIEDTQKSGVYHYSGEPNVSWYQFAKIILDNAKRSVILKPISTTDYPTPALRPLNSRLDCALTKNVFGISRPYWQHGLLQILQDLEIKNVKA